MSWENELRPEIKFTSPQWNTFYALWRNDERSIEKKLGMFDSPNFEGTIVQDLNVRSTVYPLTVYFDGIFHNKEAEDFFTALKEEVGQWEVVHPVKGILILQLISCREIMAPLTDGGYTQFDTEWIEPANVTRLISLDSLLSEIIAGALVLIEDTLLVLQQIRADAYSAIQSVTNTLNQVANVMDSVIAEIAATSALVQESYDSARAAFNNAIGAFGIGNPDPSDAGEALVAMATAPVAASSDFSTRFTAYNEMATELAALSPEMTTEDDLNTAISQEYGITLALIATAQIVASSEFSTRIEVVSAMENITNILNDSINVMDQTQDNFSTLPIDSQYFSQSRNYTSLVRLFALSMQALIVQFYNLKSESRFTLKKNRSPLGITVTEYGELGENDFYYTLFLASNNLSGNDILLLPAGKEVVIYAR